LEADALRKTRIRSEEILRMQERVEKKWITSETIAAGKLPGIEGGSQELERMVPAHPRGGTPGMGRGIGRRGSGKR